MRLSPFWLRGTSLAFWPVLELLVTVAAQLVLTPLLLHRLGPEQFGVWVLVQSTLLACSIMSLGASTGLLPVLSTAVHRGDREERRDGPGQQPPQGRRHQPSHPAQPPPKNIGGRCRQARQPTDQREHGSYNRGIAELRTTCGAMRPVTDGRRCGAQPVRVSEYR